jgi:signal transduction histidine kinase
MSNANQGSDSRQQHELLLSILERMLGLETANVSEMLNQVCDLIPQALPTEKVDVFLYDPSISTLVAIGTSKTPLGERQHTLGLNLLPLANGGVEAEVFQTGASFLTGRADQEDRVLRGVKEALGVRSLLIVALYVGGERRGVLSVSSTQPNLYSNADLTLTEVVTRWVGIMIHRAELLEHLTSEMTATARRLAAEELIGVLAHDAGNLITPISGRLYMLQARAQRDGRGSDINDLQSITRSLQRLRRMLDDLLDAGRLEHGLFTLEYRLVDVVALVRDSVEMIQTNNRAIQIRALEELVIEADEDRLRQALENLLSNALKHSPSAVPVVVDISSENRIDGPWAVVTVRDAGPGIPPDLLPRLFTRFMRGSDSRGLGLGLYIAHGIAQAHGGSLSVDSTPGVGASFTLALPTTPR